MAEAEGELMAAIDTRSPTSGRTGGEWDDQMAGNSDATQSTTVSWPWKPTWTSDDLPVSSGPIWVFRTTENNRKARRAARAKRRRQ